MTARRVAPHRARGARAHRGGRRGQDVRLRRARRVGPTTSASAPGCGRRCTGARCGAGWSTTTSALRPASTSCPLKSWLGWGPPPGRGGAGGVGGLALGRPGLLLPPDRLAGHVVRTLPDAPARRAGPAPPAGGARHAAGCGLDLARAGRHAWSDCPRRPTSIDLVLVRRGRSRRAGPAGQRAGARALGRLGRTADGAAGAPWVPGGESLGRRRAPDGRWWSAAGPAPGPRAPAGGRRRPRRARRGLPGGERAHLQRGRRRARARPAGGRALLARARRSRRLRSAADAGLRTVAPPAAEERAGWPPLERVDRRGRGPAHGLFSEEFVRLARSVARRPGGTRAVPWSASTTAPVAPACWPAATVGSWPAAHAAARRWPSRRGEEVLRCPRCDETRPVVCAACGRLRMKTLRAGVSRLREELAALLGVEVGEVAGPRRRAGASPLPADAACSIGTEAVLHRVRRAAAVAFLDIDLHLLAPRLSATEETLALFVRAARLVGAARHAGRRGPACRCRPGCPITRCSRPSRWATRRRCWHEEVAIRRRRACLPFAALARGVGSPRPRLRRGAARPARRAGRRGRRRRAAVTLAPLGEERFLLRADTHHPLCDLLARTPRPPGAGSAWRWTRSPCEAKMAAAPDPDRARRAPVRWRPCRA